MLDDINVLRQRDPSGALDEAAKQYEQALFRAEIKHGSHDEREIREIVITGMGGSALSALIAKTWLSTELPIPLEIVRGYNLPSYVGHSTLVIATSFSGNTEETLSALNEARSRGAQVCITGSGGRIIDIAHSEDIAHVVLPKVIQPRYGVIYNLKAIVALLAHFKLVSWDKIHEISALASWLESETHSWLASSSTDKNIAKQIALLAVGKTPYFYAGALTAPLAYKWKISWNENSKNVAIWNEYPEMNHNDFIGWTSHPIEKPFAVFDLVSNLEHPRILKRMEITDKLLSGKRPHSHQIELRGDSLIAQLLRGSILADFASIYVGILNGVDPAPVELIERFKHELEQ